MKNENFKKISVVMCTYNGEKYLKEQLDSIVGQSYPIFEFIIQDDCSTDATFEILEDYKQKYSYIKLYQNQQRLGCNKNFVSAMRLAVGDYIALSDQDDIWVKDKLKIQIETIGNNWLVAGGSKPFADGNVIVPVDKRRPNCRIERLIHANSVPGHTILFNRHLLLPPH